MPSVFAPCRACGKPVYVGAKRCPNCRAATSWRSRLRLSSWRRRLWSFMFAAMILAMVAIVMIYSALD